MEDIFKLFLIRNAEQPDEDAALSPSDAPLNQAINALTGDDTVSAARAQAVAFAASDAFFGSLAAVPGGPALLDLRDQILQGPIGDRAQLMKLVEARLGADVIRQASARTRQALADSILAIKLAPVGNRADLPRLVAAYQTISFVGALYDQNGEVADAAARLTKPLSLSALVHLRPAKPMAPPQGSPPVDGEAELRRAGERVSQVNDAIRELASVQPHALRSYTFQAPQPSSTSVGGLLGAVFARWTKQPITEIAAPTEGLSGLNRLKLTASAAGGLSDRTRRLLVEQNVAPERDSLFQIVRVLEDSKSLAISAAKTRNAAILGQVINFNQPVPGLGRWHVPATITPTVPTTFGSVKPVGVGEYLLVRQQLVRYEAGEIAHIENILRGEIKTRNHRRRDLTEDVSVRESEETTESERDLQSTDRFETARESREVLNEEFNVKGGLKIDAQVSPAVRIEVTADVAYRNARESALENTRKYVREVVDKVVERVKKRTREEITRRVILEVEEVNNHEFNNGREAGLIDANVIGIYQWVDKVYEAQIFRTGLPRMIYDFDVPEPACFLIGAMKDRLASEAGIHEPPEFTLDASEITEENYLALANLYGATNIEPLPPVFITRSVTFSSGASADGTSSFSQTQAVSVPDGYQALEAHIAAGFAVPAQIFVTTGRQATLFQTISGGRSLPMDLEEGSIPTAIVVTRGSVFSVSIEVVCKRTVRHETNWQIKTHGAIKEAYIQAVAKYEDALKELSVRKSSVVGLGNANPGINRITERNELKKHCTSILTGQHYDLFNGITTDGRGLPHLNLEAAAVQGPYARFFEQAFDWSLMSYVLYPYFWGRKETWVDRIRYDNVDPLFAEFIQAGSARVVVPVRPGFEGAVEHFMRTGETWSGAPIHDITDPDYLPIVEEIRSRTSRPNDEEPSGEPWEVRIPTDLVKLRADGVLPRWRMREGSEWEWEPENPA